MDVNTYLENLDKITSETLMQAKKFSPTQLTFLVKGKWSILQKLEHIFTFDRLCYDILTKPTEKISDTDELIGDVKIKQVVVDQRFMKVKSPDIVKPRGEMKNLKDFEKGFKEMRQKLKDGILTEKIKIDNRVFRHPILGDMTISDWLYFIIRHNERHLLQIKEQLTGLKQL